MASKQKRRTPRNIYTEKHAEREFQSFVRYHQLNNLPIPENLIPPSELPQAGDDNCPSAAKRQRLTTSNPSLDDDQSVSIPDVDEIDTPVQPGSNSSSDHNLESGSVCVPHQCLNGSVSGPSALNQNTFQPAPLELESDEPDTGIYIPALQVTMRNIQILKNATLEDGAMAPDDVERLRDPKATCCTLDMSDTHLVKVLRHFIYSTDTSRAHYETIRKVDMAAYPDNEFLSFDQAK
jgi:hypothetical protein